MSGFSAIGASNGWVIAALGISLVFGGLAALAIMISIFSRGLGWWQVHLAGGLMQWIKKTLLFEAKEEAEPIPARKLIKPEDHAASEAALRKLGAGLGEPFKLPELLGLAANHLEKPHSAINSMILEGKIVSGEDGLYRFREEEG